VSGENYIMRSLIEKNVIGGSCRTYWRLENCIRRFCGKEQFGRPRLGWENNINSDIE
jgi:hypothetical protein